MTDRACPLLTYGGHMNIFDQPLPLEIPGELPPVEVEAGARITLKIDKASFDAAVARMEARHAGESDMGEPIETVVDPTETVVDPTETHTLQWNPRTGYTVLGDLDEAAKAAWYADVMRERMARLDNVLTNDGSPEAIRARALAVAGWALSVANQTVTYDILSFTPENEAALHLHRIIRDANAIVTMADDPHPGDRVELHWGSLGADGK